MTVARGVLLTMCAGLAIAACRYTPTGSDETQGSHHLDATPPISIDAAPISIDAPTVTPPPPPPPPIDAPMITPADAASATPDAMPSTDAGGMSSTNTISCYRQNDPGATCALPTTCCFDNFSAQHNGACGSTSCAWGTIHCDGPEDCGGGEHCCAHAMIDPDQGLQGYTLACQASACGAAPANQELCHPGGTCANGGTCVSAYQHDNDLPRSLYICQ